MTRTPSPSRALPLLAAILALTLGGTARADYFPADPIDGPSADILSAGDLDVARDGTGAVAYLKRDGGVPHVFVSRLVDGAFGPPERIDGPSPGPADSPVVAASDGGRLAVAFTSGGQLQAVVRPNAATGFGAPQPVADAAANPSVDMSINGVAYISTTVGAGDVRIARLARDGQAFTLLPDVLDINPASVAGVGAGRSAVAISADGTALVTWGEADRVIARRVFGTRLSVAPQDLVVPGPDGSPGGAADSPRVDIEDDSSYAWVTFREAFADGRRHVVARRLVGSAFDPPVLVDGFGYPGAADASELALELSGRGEGISAVTGGGGVNASILHEDKFNTPLPLGSGTTQSRPAVGIAENNDAFAAWLPGDGSALIRPYDIDPAKRQAPPPGPVKAISRADFGPVVPELGMDMAVNRAGDANAVFVQGPPEARRLVTGAYDRPPGAFRTFTSSKYGNFAARPLSWASSFELQGRPTYRVEVDGKPVGETRDTKLAAPVADGVHTWRVVATDRRGQTATTPARTLRVDALPPELELKLTGKRAAGKPVKLAVTAADGSLDLPSGSGVKTVAISWGDRTLPAAGRLATHRYKRGTWTITVTATDGRATPRPRRPASRSRRSRRAAARRPGGGAHRRRRRRRARAAGGRTRRPPAGRGDHDRRGRRPRDGRRELDEARPPRGPRAPARAARGRGLPPGGDTDDRGGGLREPPGPRAARCAGGRRAHAAPAGRDADPLGRRAVGDPRVLRGRGAQAGLLRRRGRAAGRGDRHGRRGRPRGRRPGGARAPARRARGPLRGLRGRPGAPARARGRRPGRRPAADALAAPGRRRRPDVPQRAAALPTAAHGPARRPARRRPPLPPLREVSPEAPPPLRACGRILQAAPGRPLLMGIVNTNPDSFSDRERLVGVEAQVAHGLALAAAGADVVDVGGESGVTYTGVTAEEVEIERVVPVIERLATEGIAVSVDTWKPAVAEAALAAGAVLLNDVSGLRDERLATLCARTGAALCVMHTRAAPKEEHFADYGGAVADDVLAFLQDRSARAVALGVAEEQLLLDPGPDFAKTPGETVAVLRDLPRLHALGRPVLLAVSNKYFLGAITGRAPADRLAGTLAAVAWAARAGAAMLRVHDVAAAADVLAVTAVLEGRAPVPGVDADDDALKWIVQDD